MNTHQERPRKGGGTEAFIACRSCQGTGKFRVGTSGNGMTISEGCFACKRTGGEWRRLLPIAFTAENAHKVHAGVKTQTRRLLNPQPLGDVEKRATDWISRKTIPGAATVWCIHKPRYRVGDVLWVQEPWRTLHCWDYSKPTSLDDGGPIFYEAIPTTTHFKLGKLRPGRFLPLRFARPHRYEVVAVRCERVNAISEKDAMAEGVEVSPFNIGHAEKMKALTGVPKWSALTVGFANLWNSIHTTPGTRFEEGPWVWVYECRKVLNQKQK